MNNSPTNKNSWNGSARRNWCNGGFRQSLSDSLRSAFKQFETVTGDYNGTSSGGANITSQDYFALPAAAEVFKGRPAGTAGDQTAYSTLTEFNALTRFTWYETTSNRIKKVNGSADPWWERSPSYYYNSYFCIVNNDSSSFYDYAYYVKGLSPFGCL